METLLCHVAPTQFNYPQMMFGIACKAKHVPKSLRLTLENKKQSAPSTNVRRFMKNNHQSSKHAENIARMIEKHGLVGERIVCISGDNFQHYYRKVASGETVDPIKDSAHIVFNNAIKLGYTRPKHATDMMRSTLDPTMSTESAASTTTCGVTPHRSLFMEDPLGTMSDRLHPTGKIPDLIYVKYPVFVPHGKYYHRKHFIRAEADKPCSHTITVPTARKGECNFEDPDIFI